MKLFEVSERGIGVVKADEYTLKNGVKIRCIMVGDTVVPIPQKIKKGDYIKEDLKEAETKSGNIRLNFAETSSKDLLVLLTPLYGYRGGVHYKNLENVEILATGEIFGSPRGRLGYAKHYLLKLKEGQKVNFTRTGRLYGAEANWIVENKGGELIALPEKEYDLFYTLKG